MEKFDIAVIGASLSGSTIANILGRKGYTVALFDPKPIPGQKCCGEGLSYYGATMLRELGLWEDSIGKFTQPFRGYRIEFGDQRSLCLSGRYVEGYGIRREVIDAELLGKARALSTVRHYRNEIRSTHQENGVWYLQTGATTYAARYLVIACGEGNRSLLNGLEIHSAARARYGLSLHCHGSWLGEPPEEVLIKSDRICQTIYTPLPNQEVNISILVDQEESRRLRKSRAELAEAALRHLTRTGYAISEHSDPRGAATIHSCRVTACTSTAFLVGDAIERFDPISGLGMSHALASAALAAQAISEKDECRLSAHEAVAAYTRRREKIARRLRLVTALTLNMAAGQSPLYYYLAKAAPNLTLQLNRSLKRSLGGKPHVCFNRSAGDPSNPALQRFNRIGEYSV